MMGYGFMGPGMMGFGPMGPWMMRASGSSAEAMCSAMASHIEGRLAYVKAELKVTDAQEPLWNALPVARPLMGKCDSQVSLPDGLDQNEQLMAAQLDALPTMNKALKPLYASLSDDQKKAANQLFWGPMGMM